MSINNLKTTYTNQFGKPFPLNTEDVDYHSTRPLQTDQVLSLYEFRYENYKSHKGKNTEYESLLDSLRKFQGPKVVIHGINHKAGVTMFFTDDVTKIIIGILFSPFSTEINNM